MDGSPGNKRVGHGLSFFCRVPSFVFGRAGFPCYLQHLGAGAFDFACRLQHFGADTLDCACVLPRLELVSSVWHVICKLFLVVGCCLLLASSCLSLLFLLQL